MSHDFSGKVVFVTGGASGIGRATVDAVIAGGGQVVATGTPEEVAGNPASFTGRYLERYLHA